jgi:hypothetical protein
VHYHLQVFGGEAFQELLACIRDTFFKLQQVSLSAIKTDTPIKTDVAPTNAIKTDVAPTNAITTDVAPTNAITTEVLVK